LSASYDIRKIKAGNENEFRKLVDENMDCIYLTALRITADEDDARDIVQETFMKVWEKRKSIKSDNNIIPYIRRIAVNKCYDLMRKRKSRYGANRTVDTSLLTEIAGDSRADYKLNNDEVVSILNALASGLSPRQRIVFTMIELEELSHGEVAEITGMSKTSIKSNLSHARKKIEGLLKKYLN
jgi:RNA polymerase sigma-70 factor (ECF subfamily)